MLDEAIDPFAFYLSELREHLGESTENCLAICSLCRRAREKLNRAEFDKLCDQLGVTYPTATKWIKIDKSPRVRAYGSKLQLVGWSPWTEIVNMSDIEWQALVEEKIETAKGPLTLTRTEIAAYRRDKAKRSDSAIRTTETQAASHPEAPRKIKEPNKHLKLISVQRASNIRLTQYEQDILYQVAELLKNLERGRLMIEIGDELSSRRPQILEPTAQVMHDSRLH